MFIVSTFVSNPVQNFIDTAIFKDQDEFVKYGLLCFQPIESVLSEVKFSDVIKCFVLSIKSSVTYVNSDGKSFDISKRLTEEYNAVCKEYSEIQSWAASAPVGSEKYAEMVLNDISQSMHRMIDNILKYS